jgi:quaternary ammonium compound-resistance protein SugE
MSWIILFIAGIFEITWVISMKFSDGFTKFYPSLFTVIFAILSMGLLSFSLKTLPVGTAYAVWTGIGATGTALLGIILFDESKDFVRIFFILLIVIGLTGLRFYNK